MEVQPPRPQRAAGKRLGTAMPVACQCATGYQFWRGLRRRIDFTFSRHKRCCGASMCADQCWLAAFAARHQCVLVQEVWFVQCAGGAPVAVPIGPPAPGQVRKPVRGSGRSGTAGPWRADAGRWAMPVRFLPVGLEYRNLWLFRVAGRGRGLDGGDARYGPAPGAAVPPAAARGDAAVSGRAWGSGLMHRIRPNPLRLRRFASRPRAGPVL
jgi:hypothetical protein